MSQMKTHQCTIVLQTVSIHFIHTKCYLVKHTISFKNNLDLILFIIMIINLIHIALRIQWVRQCVLRITFVRPPQDKAPRGRRRPIIIKQQSCRHNCFAVIYKHIDYILYLLSSVQQDLPKCVLTINMPDCLQVSMPVQLNVNTLYAICMKCI